MKAVCSSGPPVCVPGIEDGTSAQTVGQRQAEAVFRELYSLWASQHGARLVSVEAVRKGGEQ